MGRILALDFGEKRIGTALSDPMKIIATPYEVINKNKVDMYEKILSICKTKQVEQILIGMPYHLDGRKGKSAMQVEKFVESLKMKTEIPVKTWDERFSSKEAERVLIDAGTSREKRRQVVDKLAAQLILQNYLDAQQGP